MWRMLEECPLYNRSYLFSSLAKTYPKSSILCLHYSKPASSPTIIAGCFVSTSHPNGLSHCSQSDDFEIAPQFMLLLYLKSSCGLSSMAFRMKSQIIIPGLQCPSPSGLPLRLISSPIQLPVHSPFSSLTCQAHSCLGPLHQLFPLSQIILSPSLCLARFFLYLRSQWRTSMTPTSCGLFSFSLFMPILILCVVLTTLCIFFVLFRSVLL